MLGALSRDFGVRVTRVPLQFIVRDETREGNFCLPPARPEGVWKSADGGGMEHEISSRANRGDSAVRIASVAKVFVEVVEGGDSIRSIFLRDSRSRLKKSWMMDAIQYQAMK